MLPFFRHVFPPLVHAISKAKQSCTNIQFSTQTPKSQTEIVPSKFLTRSFPQPPETLRYRSRLRHLTSTQAQSFLNIPKQKVLDALDLFLYGKCVQFTPESVGSHLSDHGLNIFNQSCWGWLPSHKLADAVFGDYEDVMVHERNTCQATEFNVSKNSCQQEFFGSLQTGINGDNFLAIDRFEIARNSSLLIRIWVLWLRLRQVGSPSTYS